MNKIIKDIREVVGCDVNLSFTINYGEFLVWIGFDEHPNEEIPIMYSVESEHPYIPFSIWHKTNGYPQEYDLNEETYGIDFHELKVINNVCDYLYSQRGRIMELLDFLRGE